MYHPLCVCWCGGVLSIMQVSCYLWFAVGIFVAQCDRVRSASVIFTSGESMNLVVSNCLLLYSLIVNM